MLLVLWLSLSSNTIDQHQSLWPQLLKLQLQSLQITIRNIKINKPDLSIQYPKHSQKILQLYINLNTPPAMTPALLWLVVLL
jgi:hypothetical protein